MVVEWPSNRSGIVVVTTALVSFCECSRCVLQPWQCMRGRTSREPRDKWQTAGTPLIPTSIASSVVELRAPAMR